MDNDNCMKYVPPKKLNEIVIGTINVRTLTDDIKLGTTYDLFKSLRHTISCFQETRRLGHGILEHEGTQLVYSGKKKKKEYGVGTMISESTSVSFANSLPRFFLYS